MIALCAIMLSACAAREQIFPLVGMDAPALRDFPEDFTPPLSSETGRPMPGFGGGGGGVERTPVIFIHGNTVSARFWLPARKHFLAKGYHSDELWSLGYGWDNARYLDGDDLSVASVERIVSGVTAYLSKKTGRQIRQVDIVAHSLGVTLVRQWMKQNNAWHRVRNFVGATGGNDGVWTAWMDARTQSRVVSFELAPGSPWLAQLSRGGETPGPTRYMTLYDGTGWYDVLFPHPFEDGGALEGAHNVAFNREHGTHYDHLELPREPDTMDAMIEFFRQSREALPQAGRPALKLNGASLAASEDEALVHCTADGEYPNSATPGVKSVELPAGSLQTCFARSERTQLASPMARYRNVPGYTPAGELTLSIDPPGGVFEQPQNVSLKASDPEAFVVYTTSGYVPNSGSPLYTEPVYVPGPLTLRARAIAPDGRTSKPVKVKFDISLELVEARHTLQRQFDPTVQEKYEGRRHVGR
ncbi:MAG TPA: chitobiase/beta-hexosaminidase C-terminal domain-containing protein [Solimonas sp.]|nr:chitobiase/beta-hexosaminidase C-terminal domain-containing protein [Solimonas sp.]